MNLESDHKDRFKFWIEYFNQDKKFESVEDIPSIPVLPSEFMKEVVIPGLIKMGAIPKSDLVVGKDYLGDCRNASRATWNGEELEYLRYKWGSHYVDTTPHFEDDDGSDFFIPIKQLD